jgi:hypothetical protein
MARRHVLWQTDANTIELAASILYTEDIGSSEMFVSINHTTHFHTEKDVILNQQVTWSIKLNSFRMQDCKLLDKCSGIFSL